MRVVNRIDSVVNWDDVFQTSKDQAAMLNFHRQDGHICHNAEEGQDDKKNILTSSNLSYCQIINHGVFKGEIDVQLMAI